MSSDDLPLVSGTPKRMKNIAVRLMKENTRNKPDALNDASNIGPNLVTTNIMTPQLAPATSDILDTSWGKSSAFIVQAKGPAPREKNKMMKTNVTNGNHFRLSTKVMQSVKRPGY